MAKIIGIDLGTTNSCMAIISGDKVLDKRLADIGGKGLFVKELEVAMQQGEADIAEAVGFRYRYEPSTGEYQHQATLVVLGGDGSVASNGFWAALTAAATAESQTGV